MRKLLSVAVVAVLLVLQSAPARADDVINVRVSIKVILSPTGQLPQGVNLARMNVIVLSDLNSLSQQYWRGYRFQLVGGIQTIGGTADPNGPSRFFDGIGTLTDLYNAAIANPTAFAWDPSTINIYIDAGTTDGFRGIAGCVSDNPHHCMAVIVGTISEGQTTYLHEIGHVFGLCHTQGCPCGVCDPDSTGMCHTEPGDDRIADTLPDLQCWTTDEIAGFSFGTDFANLSPADQEQVLNVRDNIMSYHFVATGSRLTEGQLDRWADVARRRGPIVDGQTLFVAPGGAAGADGTSTHPFGSVASALAAANPAGGDILLFRPGRYFGSVIIDQPVALRATRVGPAVIGLPLPPSPGGVTCPPANAPRKTKCCEVLPNGMCRSVTDCIDPTAPTGGCP